MEVHTTEIDEIVDPTGNAPLPRPVPARKCQCGCEVTFWPKRKDHVYLNKQHADFAYNHGKRKAKNRARIRDEKILLKNDIILDKHFSAEKASDQVERFYDVIKAEGFQSGYYIGRVRIEDIEYHITYRYVYRIFKQNGILKIVIKKR